MSSEVRSRIVLEREGSKPRRGARRLVLGLAAGLFCTPHATARAAGTVGEAVNQRTREAAILETVARGQVPGGLAESYLGEFVERPREQFEPEASVALELDGALQELRSTLDRRSGEVASEGALRSALDRFETARERMFEELLETERRLRELGIGGEIEARRAGVEVTLRARFDGLAAATRPLREALRTDPPVSPEERRRKLAAASDPARLIPFLDAAIGEGSEPAAERPILRSSTLPYSRRDLAPRLPRTAPSITPSYGQIAPAPPTGGDLAGGEEAQLSGAILLAAESVGHDPVRLFELVRNTIRYEPYAGAWRGAEGTLRAGAGNDVDQSSLLVALLRASGIPARYVRGVAEHPIEALQEELRLAGAPAVLEALRRAGLPVRPVVRGGRIAAVEVERTWVAARVPYANYRGAVVDLTGETWIPLAPWMKRETGPIPTGVLPAMAFDAEAFVDAALATPSEEPPLAGIRAEVESYLASSAPGSTYSEQLGDRQIVAQSLGLLPSSLPFEVRAVTWEGATLDPSDVARIRIRAANDASGVGEPILEARFPLSEVAGRRTTVSYLPATVDDHRAVLAWGGMSSVPAYLVHLRPVVRIAGRQEAVGEPLPMGTVHRLEVEFELPGDRVEAFDQDLVAGSYHALAIGAPSASPESDDGDDPADTERIAARILSGLAHGYFEHWDAAEDEIAALYDLLWIRPSPAAVFASCAFTVTRRFDLPWLLRFDGVTLDAALRGAEPIARGGDAAPSVAALRLSALAGSALEHSRFEESFLVDALSADKALALAAAAGVERLSIDASNVDAVVPTLALAPAVREEIRSWALRGMNVLAPRAEIERNAWRGAAFRVEDPESGAAGYFLSGALAGGATTEAPGNWVLQFLAAALAAPYTEPNLDPLAGAVLRKVETTDGQQAVVGAPFGEPLAVEVRDSKGAPVVGAEVTFVSLSGGGRFLFADGSEGAVATVLSGATGVASVAFRAGTDTSLDPVFRKLHPDDLYTTRLLAHVVEAAVASHQGELRVSAPFALFARPGAVTHLARTDGSFDDPIDLLELGIWAHTIQVEARDTYENPVSNVSIFATVEMSDSTPPECLYPVENPLPAAVFAREDCELPTPILGECGDDFASVITTANGALIGVIGPNEIRPFEVLLTAPPAPAAVQRYGIHYSTVSDQGLCQTAGDIRIRSVQLTDGLGNNIRAERSGEIHGPIQFEVLFWDPYDGLTCTNCPPCGVPDVCNPGPPPAGGVWRRGVDPSLFEPEIVPELSVSNGGSATPAILLERGLFETTVTVGPATGKNIVGSDLFLRMGRCPQVICDGSPTFPHTVEDQYVTSVWGVEPRVAAVAPSPIPVSPTGFTEQPLVVHYVIDPGEYTAASVEVVLLHDGEEIATGFGNARQGAGTVVVQRGFALDQPGDYAAQLVLNRGGEAEVRSDLFPLPISQRLFDEVSESVLVSQEVDPPNRRVCSQPDHFHFFLSRPATVTLELFGLQALTSGGYEDDGSHVVLIANESLEEGTHDIDVSPADLSPGRYRYLLRGEALGDGFVDVREGSALSQYRSRDSLPVGHELVEGVDLFDGHLTLSRQDFVVPGRGGEALSLSFARSYSSEGGGEIGSVGVGWSMNWGSKVIVTPCGEAIVIGGEGTGMRFVDDGAGGLRPLKGYHGSLVANPDFSFDFYAKGGNRYHYLRTTGAEWELDRVVDPNGNVLRLLYEASFEVNRRRVSSVVDASGRTLRFTWEVRDFASGRAEVIRRVDGPLGLAVDLEYDDFGNLTRASREPHGGGEPSAVESYRYEIQPLAAFDDHHVLVEAKDEVRQASTLYTWQRGTIGLTGGVAVPRVFVTTVTRPEGGTTAFAFDLATLEVLDGAGVVELEVGVTDPREKEWVYRVNGYGSLVYRRDPLDHEIAMTWSLEDVVPTSRTNENGVTTTYAHDAFGNRTSETVTVVDVDGVGHDYSWTRTFEPPGTFDPPYIKDRVATATDRSGAVRSYDYDVRGNRIRETIDVTDAAGASTTVTTERAYFPNGDLRTLLNPRHFLTTFAYDAFGNPNRITDARNGVTSRSFDPRGRLRSETDARGQTTSFEYDTLDRKIRSIFPEVGSLAAETRTEYDDVSRRMVAYDAEENATTTLYDHEGRVVEIDDAAGGSKRFEWDVDGNKTLESTWFDGGTPRHDTTFVYDDAGRLVERDEPLGRTTVYDYDAAGNVVRETLSDAADPLFRPRVTESDSDALDRRVEVRRQLDGEWSHRRYLLDGEGRTIAEDDPLDRRRTFRYDALGRQIEAVEPEWRPGEPKTTRWFYDANGNRTREVRDNESPDGEGGWAPASQTREWVHDELDRVRELHDAEGKVTVREYDAVGNLTREISPRLVVTEHVYDARNRRERTRLRLDRFTSPPRNVETAFEYDRNGNLVETRLPNGNVVTRTLDALSRVVAEGDSLGPLATYAYDARGNVTHATDPRGSETANRFDALDRRIEQDLPEDRHLAWTWDAAGNKVTEENARGFVTTFAYDALDRLASIVDPEPFASSRLFTYDLAGNRRSETNRRGLTTSYDFDALDRVTRIVDPAPLAFERTFAYDANGNVLAETDRRTIETSYRYDRENRRTSTRRAGVELERVEYDEVGNRRFVTDANGNITGFVWDERNLLLQESRPLAAITKHRYDDLGDRVASTDPENHVSTFAWDRRRRMTLSTDDLGEATAFCYDETGNRTGVRKPKFPATSDPCGGDPGLFAYEFDRANRLTAVVDPLGDRTEYAYDENGNRTSQLDDNLHETTFAFDALDRLESKTYPGGATESYGYDANGNRDSLTDPKGQSFAYGYDALDRLVTETLPVPVPPTGDELESRTTTYDPNGNVLSRVEQYSTSGEATYSGTWDAFDRRLTATDRFGEPIAYTYDANGNRRSVRDSDGVVTSYTYDALNRLASQTGPGGVTTYDYFKNGLLKKRTNPNGSSATHAYDRANRTQSIVNRQFTSVISSYAYEYDANGNRTRQVEVNGGAPEETTYGYDAADRLTEVVYPDETVTYTLDGVGNRLTETVVAAGGGTTSAKTLLYDARDRLQSVTDVAAPENSATYSWDANGNQVGRTREGVFRRHLYDALDRLVEVEEVGTLLERYGYDPMGYRVRKAGLEGVFRYVRDDSAILQQTDDAGNTIARYEWGGDGLVAMTHVSEGRRFSLFDGLGSVTVWSRADGGVGLRRSFDAWGEIRSESGDTEALFAFTGYEFDEATGAYYAKARYYEPEIGRFLNEDPFQGLAETPPSLHRFLYAHGNPTLFIDPSGMCVFGLPCPEIVEKAKEAVAAAAEELVTVVTKRAAGIVVAAQKDEIPLAQAAMKEGLEVAQQGAQMTASALRGDVAAMMDQRGKFLEKQSSKAKAEVEALPVVRVAAGQATMVGSALGGDFEGAARQAVRNYANGMEDAALIAGAAMAPSEAPGAVRSTPTRIQSATVGESAATGGAEVAEVATTQSAPATTSAQPMTAAEIKAARQRGTYQAKRAERELVESGHPGTVEDGWSWSERKQIAETGQYPSDTRWHHINDVKRNPELADVPDNVIPSRGAEAGHVKRYHPQGTQAGSSGPLLEREKLTQDQRVNQR